MTRKELTQCCRIPPAVLREYDSLEVRSIAEAQDQEYGDGDLARLSLLLTLRDIGFAPEERAQYLSLLAEGKENAAELLRMLAQKRSGLLQDIHQRERQLAQLDYLRHQITKPG